MLLYNGGPQHTGAYDTKPLVKLTGLRWEFEREGTVYSKPALAGDMLYFGSGDHFLWALDPGTGKLMWKFGAQAAVNNPTVYDGHVYFGSGNALYSLE